MKWSQDEFNTNKSKIIKILNRARDLKIKPGLDNKKISSWNGIMLKGLCDAYSIGKMTLLKLAISNVNG